VFQNKGVCQNALRTKAMAKVSTNYGDKVSAPNLYRQSHTRSMTAHHSNELERLPDSQH